jgi:hypothetical protein
MSSQEVNIDLQVKDKQATERHVFDITPYSNKDI